MTRRRCITLLALMLGVPTTAPATVPGPLALTDDTRTIRTIGNLLGVDAFDQPVPPAHADALERAGWILEEAPAAGRTPMDWVRFVRDGSPLTAPATHAAPGAELVAQVERIYHALALDFEPARTPVTSAAASLPAGVRAAFAELVSDVADVYVEQLPLAHAIVARLGDGTAPPIDLVSEIERDLMAGRQQRLVRSVALFRARTAGLFPDSPKGALPFSDPEGLVVLGGTGSDTYARGGMFPDPILLVDLDGNDRYENSAGGACPVTEETMGTWMECNGLVLSVVADLGEGGTATPNDVYTFTGQPSPVHGAGGPGGIGILIDVGGNDRYTAKLIRSSTDPWGPTSYFDAGAQGFSYGGAGLLLDGLGDDRYTFTVDSTNGRSIWGLGQGFGGAGGLGVLHDVSGDDTYISHARSTSNGGFVGVYTNGTGFFGGVGIQLETGLGNDTYISDAIARSVDYYAIGFGAFGGVGILYEDGGDDDYYTYEEGFNSSINPLLNCAYGTASFGGIGVMVDVAGDDVYYGGTKSGTGGATVMDWGFGGPGVGYGLFVDLGGRDVYKMEAIPAPGKYKMITGHGVFNPAYGLLDGANIFGTFVDIGGNDSYIPGPWGNNNQWTFGVDRSA